MAEPLPIRSDLIIYSCWTRLAAGRPGAVLLKTRSTRRLTFFPADSWSSWCPVSGLGGLGPTPTPGQWAQWAQWAPQAALRGRISAAMPTRRRRPHCPWPRGRDPSGAVGPTLGAPHPNTVLDPTPRHGFRRFRQLVFYSVTPSAGRASGPGCLACRALRTLPLSESSPIAEPVSPSA